MTAFDLLTDAAYSSGAPVGVQINDHLLAAVFVDGYLVWCLDGVMIDPDEAASIINDLTT